MKKLISILLIFNLLLCACLTACSKGEDGQTTASGSSLSDTKKPDKTESDKTGSDKTEAQKPESAEADETELEDADYTVQTTKDISGQSKISGFKSFKGRTLDGESVDGEIFKNAKLTVVNVWGTFCSPCIGELPHLGEIAKEYKKKDVQIIGLVGDAYSQSMTVDDAVVDDAKSIIKDTNADYLHIIPDIALYRELLTNMTAFPTTYFIDSDGNYVGKAVVGAMDKAGWEEKIDAVLSSME